tara:strand:- start:876 stop:1271 length:396 start_codon:yes stop_codon:yes gene_type:complete
MIEYFTVALLSIMIFYSFGIAFNVHRTLDKENAGKLLRKLFPLYFLWGIIISILAEIILLYQGLSLKALFMAIVAIGFLYSRQVLVPLLNKNRDMANEGNSEAKKIFGSLHFRSVSINIIQMLLLIAILAI